MLDRKARWMKLLWVAAVRKLAVDDEVKVGKVLDAGAIKAVLQPYAAMTKGTIT